MVFSLLIGAAIAKGLAEGRHVSKGGMSFQQEDEFDKKVGYEGIDPTNVMQIAKRCGVYTKKGVLPPKPPKYVLDYVKKYADNPTDVEEFKRNWTRTIDEQLSAKHGRIRNNSLDSKMYDKNLQHRKNSVIPNLSSNKTRIFAVEHWMGMSKSEHQRRVNKIVNNTILSEFLAGKPVLRENNWTMGGHTEYYKVKINADSKKTMSDSEFNRLYRECCAKVGYEY